MKRPLIASAALMLAAAFTLTGCGQLQNLVGGGDTAVRDETTSEITDAGDLDVFTLAIGDCFNDEGAGESISSVPVVPCSEPHDNEVYYEFELPAGDFPEASELDTVAGETCGREFEAFVGIAYADSALDYFDIRPTQDSWENVDDRIVQCAVYDTAPVTGTLAGAQR